MKNKFLPTDRFSLRPDLVVEEVDDEVIVLDLEGNQYFGLNNVGWMIWKAIADEDRPLEEIVSSIATQFEIDGALARQDAEAFLVELIEAGLATKQPLNQDK